MASSLTGKSATKSGGSSSGGSAKAIVSDQITQSVQSTYNLVHLMQQSSSSQAKLARLPRNLMAKCSTIKNTGQVLEQMPRVIASLDAYMDNGLQSVPHLKTVVQLLANMESSQLTSFSEEYMRQEKHDPENQTQDSN